MEIRFPFGGSLRASGRMVTLVILVVGLAALGVWHDVRSTEQTSAIFKEMRVMSYILTLSEAEKKRLNVAMPEELRLRLQARRQQLNANHEEER